MNSGDSNHLPTCHQNPFSGYPSDRFSSPIAKMRSLSRPMSDPSNNSSTTRRSYRLLRWLARTLDSAITRLQRSRSARSCSLFCWSCESRFLPLSQDISTCPSPLPAAIVDSDSDGVAARTPRKGSGCRGGVEAASGSRVCLWSARSPRRCMNSCPKRGFVVFLSKSCSELGLSYDLCVGLQFRNTSSLYGISGLKSCSHLVLNFHLESRQTRGLASK